MEKRIAGAGGSCPSDRPPSAVLVLPVPPLAFGHPFDGLCESAGACFGALGFADPFGIFLFMAVAERCESGQRCRLGFKGGGQFRRNDQLFFDFGFDLKFEI